MNLLRRGICPADRLRQRIAQRRHAQHAAARRHIARVRQSRARVVHRRARRFRVRQTGDRLAALVFSGIAAAGQHDAGRRAAPPADLRLRQPLLANGAHDGKQVAFQQGQNGLRLRVAEARVIFHHLRPLRRQHQPDVEHALEREALRVHRVERRQQNLALRPLRDLLGIERAGGKRAHAAGVRPLVAVQRALVILTRLHRYDRLAVAEAEHRHLAPDHTFLDEHPRAALAEFAALHHLHNGLLRLFHRRRDDHALAQRQPIRLDDNRRALRVQIRQRLVHLGEDFALRRGDSVFAHQVFGEDLARLHLRRVSRRPKRRNPRRLQLVHAAQRQRIIRRDADKIDLFPLRQRDNTLDIRRLDLRDAPRDLRNTRVARRAEDLRHVLRFAQLFAYSVLASAAANHQYLHKHPPQRKNSVPPARSGRPEGTLMMVSA